MAEIALPASVLGAPWMCSAAERFDIAGATATLGERAVDRRGEEETMHPYARVAVLRLPDLQKIWDGFADANGHWKADGLQPGFEYVAVGIDQKRVFKATAAGPVKATVEGGNG